MAKTYEELLNITVENQRKLEEARQALALKIGLDFLKRNPKITSFKKYKELGTVPKTVDNSNIQEQPKAVTVVSAGLNNIQGHTSTNIGGQGGQ